MEEGVQSNTMVLVFLFVPHYTISRELALFLFVHSFYAALSKDYCINKTLLI